jgi:peptidoglycan/LPS O-acetylase OafA/YrhL
MNESPLPKTGLKYRGDIDGLRAIAVLAVLAFHTGVLHLGGGFVGVDVFFVISGYLISFIVFSEIAGSRFSIVGFYERRIRRIFPALFAMLAVLSAFVVFYLLPTELMDYGKTLLATTFSASNFYLWLHTGYFDSQQTNPLLHTWSLAVEEQFYILFPLFLVLVRRFFPKRLRISVVVLFFLSLLASAVVVINSRTTAFYMPYTRAWELLLGTLLSLGLFPRLHSAVIRNMAALTGFGMVIGAARFYSDTTVFPGLSALIPCLGSALIIGAGESGSSVVAAVLSWRPVVFVGLISYSLYLWHWPVIIMNRMGVFFRLSRFVQSRHGRLLPPDRFEHLVLIVVSFGLATLSWWFVERPFRKGPLRLSGLPLFALAGSVMMACVGFSALVMSTGGLKGRFSPEAQQFASYLDNKEDQAAMRTGNCFILDSGRFEDFDQGLCLHEEAGKKNYLLLGDSHAAILWSALSAALPGRNVMQATVAACEPIVREPNTRPICKVLIDYIFQKYLPTHPVDALLLEGSWSEPDSVDRIGETVEWAKAHHVPLILFGPVPEYDEPLPRLLAYQVEWNQANLAEEHRKTDGAALDSRLETLSRDSWHITYISLYKQLCNGNDCIEYVDSAHTVPLMSDREHFTRFGSAMIVHELVSAGEIE